MIKKKKLKFIQITLILLRRIIFYLFKKFSKRSGKEILSKDAKIKITKD